MQQSEEKLGSSTGKPIPAAVASTIGRTALTPMAAATPGTSAAATAAGSISAWHASTARSDRMLS